MYNDDELIGLEDVQEFELEQFHRQRWRHLLDTGQKSESTTAPGCKSKHEWELETEIILEPLPDPKPIPDQESNHRPFEDTGPETKTDFVENPGTGEGAHMDPDTESELPAAVSRQCRFAILSEKMMDDRRYVALAKSIDDLQYREQLFEEYGIAPPDTTEH